MRKNLYLIKWCLADKPREQICFAIFNDQNDAVQYIYRQLYEWDFNTTILEDTTKKDPYGKDKITITYFSESIRQIMTVEEFTLNVPK